MLLVNLSQNQSKSSPYLSETLLNSIEETLKNKKKVILYLNKRGAYSSLICEHCSYLYRCEHCDINLTVHSNSLECHMCGYSESLTPNCKKCKNTSLKKIGVGTQQIENQLSSIFPESHIFRFDADSMKKKSDKQKALESLDSANIIIGTKMITTGFDLKNIGLISVILIEQELSMAQYDNEEKLYQNIKQLFGRGQRSGETCEYLIQSFIPANTQVQSIIYDNYKEYFIHSLKERKMFSYPPFSELAIIESRSIDKEKGLESLQKISEKLKKSSPDLDMSIHTDGFKKAKQYYYKMYIKGTNVRKSLGIIQKDILSQKGISIYFDS